MMARSCKFLSDVRRRPEIDAQLLLGRSLTLVAAVFQVSRSTLGRDSKLHVRERAARARRGLELGSSVGSTSGAGSSSLSVRSSFRLAP